MLCQETHEASNAASAVKRRRKRRLSTLQAHVAGEGAADGNPDEIVDEDEEIKESPGGAAAVFETRVIVPGMGLQCFGCQQYHLDLYVRLN